MWTQRKRQNIQNDSIGFTVNLSLFFSKQFSSPVLANQKQSHIFAKSMSPMFVEGFAEAAVGIGFHVF
ncbi:MAG: hypothetical protein LIP00_05100 [Parabacteroides sp.]|nr:hypothetical protein [Parabacteroides sp.]